MTEREELDKASSDTELDLLRSILRHRMTRAEILALEAIIRKIAREEIVAGTWTPTLSFAANIDDPEVRASAGGGGARTVYQDELDDCYLRGSVAAPAPVAPETGGSGFEHRVKPGDMTIMEWEAREALRAAHARIAEVENDAARMTASFCGAFNGRAKAERELARLRAAAESARDRLIDATDPGCECKQCIAVAAAVAALTAALTGTGEAQTRIGGDSDNVGPEHQTTDRGHIAQPAQEDSPVPAPFKGDHSMVCPNCASPLILPSPDKTLVEALEAAELLDDRDDCPECEGEGEPEKCPLCFEKADKARVLRRAALAARKGGSS